ncbi:MarR family winged helix-turn-helix transcriptional regulator [Subtercola boreus]|uniref:MarR family transcriptional regulator n=1 Tax=Subtercola boreus TaxID=120213 RepID=A0A3E0WD35_9MICO|nr:MarR family transcriptional regulator [Subtercola boreus]RFA22720.1 MarR family transcriptional regulator [Subtercola boreus]RFA23075.1 MarR family transcriptional regulator [Subtercola boreus]RFA28828.1 MarR family transcriptional regulator [Subtercola boreus]
MSQAAPDIDLDTSIGYLLKQAASALHAAMDAVLRPLGLNITQYSCLELLAQRPGLSSSELARGAFVSRQSMNVLLQSLEGDDLVSRPGQAPVGRVLPVQLTPAGAALRVTASAAVRAVEERMLGGLDREAEGQLRSGLRACAGALSAAYASSGAASAAASSTESTSGDAATSAASAFRRR